MSLATLLTRYAAMGVVIGLGAMACVGSESTEPEGPAYPTETSFCKALAGAVCSQAVVEACYFSDASTLAADTEACVAAYSQRTRCNPDDLGYSYPGAEACIAAMKAMYADGKISKTELAAAAEACLPVLSKGLPAGSPCTADTDCDGAGGLECVDKPGQTPVCQSPEEVSPGGACDAPDQVCPEGYFCNAGEAGSYCVVKRDIGKVCSDTEPCVEAARCVDAVCVAKTANGGACTADEECEGFCIIATGASEGTCGAQLVLSPTTADSCAPFLP